MHPCCMELIHYFWIIGKQKLVTGSGNQSSLTPVFNLMKSNWKKNSALFVLTGYLILFFMSVFHTHELSSNIPGINQQQSRTQHSTHHYNESGECLIHLAFSALHNSDLIGVSSDRGQFGDPELLSSAIVTPILPIPESCTVSRGPPSVNSSI